MLIFKGPLSRDRSGGLRKALHTVPQDMLLSGSSSCQSIRRVPGRPESAVSKGRDTTDAHA